MARHHSIAARPFEKTTAAEERLDAAQEFPREGAKAAERAAALVAHLGAAFGLDGRADPALTPNPDPAGAMATGLHPEVHHRHRP